MFRNIFKLAAPVACATFWIKGATAGFPAAISIPVALFVTGITLGYCFWPSKKIFLFVCPCGKHRGEIVARTRQGAKRQLAATGICSRCGHPGEMKHILKIPRD